MPVCAGPPLLLRRACPDLVGPAALSSVYLTSRSFCL